MNNQQLITQCREILSEPENHTEWCVEITRLALERLESEPVAWVKSGAFSVPRLAGIDAVTIPHVPEFIVELYAAPPAPVMKPVVMPKSEYVPNYGYAFDMNDIFVALDAAGVKYEVKS